MPQSPQQKHPLLPPNLPRNQKGQIINPTTHKPTGSKQIQFYDKKEDDPTTLRIFEIEDLIQQWRVSGRLFHDDPHVEQTLEEYDALKLKEANNPLDFSNEVWNAESTTNEDDQDPAATLHESSDSGNAEKA